MAENMDSTTCGGRVGGRAPDDLLSIVRAYSDAIRNDRTLSDIGDHLRGEVQELDQELIATDPGEDGIAGEAVDVVLCALDIVFKARPDWSDADIVAYAERKCRKWASKNQN
jgi:hypothetical protein